MTLRREYKLNRYKGIIVVDVIGSPLWRAATSHSQRNNVEILSAFDYPTVRKLVRAIVIRKPDFVIFSWRGALDRVLQSNYSKQKLLTLDPWIFLLIPDYLGVKHFSKEEQNRLNLCDGILVTSSQLVCEYQELYQVSEIQLLHDLPDLDLIRDVSEKNFMRTKNRVIWVGNSKWGERAGYQDHKGFRRFVLPVENVVNSKIEGASFRLIDTAYKKLPNINVLEEIANSECLIITSDSEGTALPILEAAALGVPVVSFDVGIASELFGGDLKDQISPRDLELLASKIESTLANFEYLSYAFKSRFEEYRLEVMDDLARIHFSPRKNGEWRTNKSNYNFIHSLKWGYRWLKR